MLLVFAVNTNAQKMDDARLIINLDGYSGKMISINFMQTPELNMEFPYNAETNSKIDYSFNIKDIEGVYINGQLICMEPNTSLSLNMEYIGGRFKKIEIISSSSERLMQLNKLLSMLLPMRRESHFKTRNLTWAVIGTSVKEHFKKNLQQLDIEKGLFNKNKTDLTTAGYNYAIAEIESTIYTNIINYPFTIASTTNVPVESIINEDYTTFLKDYTIRADKTTLRNRNYASFLVSYYRYNLFLKEYQKSETKHNYNENVVSIFNGLSKFYTGEVRDTALFAFLYQEIISSNIDFTLVEKLCYEYFDNYNIDTVYKEELKNMLQ